MAFRLTGRSPWVQEVLSFDVATLRRTAYFHNSSRCMCSYETNKPVRSKKLSEKRSQQLISKILRVDHAGEVGANMIYAGQLAVLRGTPSGPVIEEMWEQEKHHMNTFNKLLPKYRARPTSLLPIWNVAGFVLGAGTALLGKEAAMACTIAVEESIGEHYNSQLREILATDDPDKYSELLEIIREFRDDELEHLETGIEHDGELAPGYDTLKQVIQAGCSGAIWLFERI